MRDVLTKRESQNAAELSFDWFEREDVPDSSDLATSISK